MFTYVIIHFWLWKTDSFCRLTSWAIRIFKHASFQDWENLFYIEPQIITRCTEWILHFQTEVGSFEETKWYHNPLDAKMQGKVHCFDALYFNWCGILFYSILYLLQENHTGEYNYHRYRSSLSKNIWIIQ
jgi:hypothetical protein